MISLVEFAPLSSMAFAPPCADTVVVSVLDASQHPRRPCFEGFLDCLALTFIDLSEEHFGLRSGAWPAEPTAAQHRAITELDEERVVSLSDAVSIVRYLRKHHAGPDEVRVLVHCFAGASRSAAIALWASTRFKAPLKGHSRDNDMRDVNKRVGRLLRTADRRLQD